MVSELDSQRRYINIEWIYKEYKAWFELLEWSNLAWNFSKSCNIF